MMMTQAEEKLDALFEELVPASGKSDTVAGEIVRAVTRIVYRAWNDGDHVGVGYGKETCNPAARFLMAKAGENIAEIVKGMWGITSDKLYDKAIEALEEETIAYIDANPDLKTMQNINDMLDFRVKSEDVDDSWMDDEDVYYGEEDEE